MNEKDLEIAKAAVASEGEKIGRSVASAMSVLALMIIASTDRVDRSGMIAFAKSAAVRFREAGETTTAALLEKMAEQLANL